MNELKIEPNSYKYKERARTENGEKNEKKIEKVIVGEAKTKKKSTFSKDVENVKDYVIKDVLIPLINKHRQNPNGGITTLENDQVEGAIINAKRIYDERKNQNA